MERKEISRREFIRGAILTAAGMAVSSCIDGDPDKRWGVVEKETPMPSEWGGDVILEKVDDEKATFQRNPESGEPWKIEVKRGESAEIAPGVFIEVEKAQPTVRVQKFSPRNNQ